MARKRINILFAMMKNDELYHAPDADQHQKEPV